MKSSEDIERLKAKNKALEDALDRQRQKISLKTIFSIKGSGKTDCAVSISLLSKLIDSSVDGIIAADRTGNLLVFNAAAAAIYGYEIEKALSTLNIRDLYPKAGAYEVMAKLRSDGYGGPGRLAGHLVNVLDKEGQLVPVRMNASIVYENEAEIATIGYLRDLRESDKLTDGIQNKQTADQDVSLDEFLSSVTRQLKVYDQQFCVGAIKNDLATVDQVKKALRKQSEVLEKAKVHVPIGRIMIQLDILTEVQRDSIVNLYRIGSRDQTSGLRHQENAYAHKDWPLEEAVTLVVSADRLEAAISIATNSAHSFSKDDLHDFLKERGIEFGIVANALIEEYFISNLAGNEPLTIAKGQPPVPETPPQIKYHFSFGPLGVGTPREDGTIDWKNRGKLPQARSGDVLADISPGSPGVSGTDIFGEDILPPTAKSNLPKCGKGVAFSEDGNQYLAKSTGLVFIEGDRLSLMETLVVEEDVGLETGHIDFDGHVEVGGSIHKGYRVNCKSLRVADIHEAEITVAGDMVVMGGIYESTIKCNGGLQVPQIRKSQVQVGCDLIVQKEIMESGIESSGQCLIENGTIIFSQISAKNGVVAGNLGTKGSKPSTLLVGIDQQTKRKIKYTKNKLELQRKDLKRLPGEIKGLEENLQSIEVEKADLSETLSCHVERIESMEKQLEMLEAQGRESGTSKMHKIIANLISEKARMESLFLSLDKEMERISERSFKKHDDIDKGNQELELLEDKLESLISEKATHAQGAVVRVSGIVYSGTIVSGPHASITIDDDLASLVIKESKQVDEAGKETVVMQMSALD